MCFKHMFAFNNYIVANDNTTGKIIYHQIGMQKIEYV